MKPRHFASAAKVFLPLLCLVSLCLLTAPAKVRGEVIMPPAMQNYCAEPPFAAAGIKSNLLLMLDNSSSMYDIAYMNESTSDRTYCLDDTYRNDRSYTGYFDPARIYTYDSARNRFHTTNLALPSSTCNEGSCVASTEYLYLEMAPPVPPATHRTVSAFRASGNFLNWLSASRMDIQKKVLTGGKFVPDPANPPGGVLQAETRGCQGKRFVKMIDGINATFVVRGPTLPELGFTYDTSRGGGTTIEIYDKRYRKEECLAAIRAWGSGDRTILATHANACMDAGEEAGPFGIMPSEGQIFSAVMTLCYDFIQKNVPLAFDQGLWDLCYRRWVGLFGINYIVTQLEAVDGFCGRNIRHTTGSNTRGFGGQAALDGKATGLPETFRAETINYCNELRNPSVTDPSSAASISGGGAQIPSFILDAGVYYLGRPAATYKVNVLVESPTVGLVQEFSSSINFGVMAFNSGVTDAECQGDKISCAKHCSAKPEMNCFGTGDCIAVQKGICTLGADGGRVISYINDPASPLGDHGSGLIGAIDNVTGSTFTPYAEAFYNAIGYYGGRTDLRLSSGDFDLLLKPSPSQYACQKNNILIISDGMSTADSNPSVESLASLYAAGREAVTGRAGDIPPFLGSRSLDDLAWIAAHRNIKNFSLTVASTAAPVAQNQSITTHVIFTGISNGAPGEADPATLMRRTAVSGGGVFAAASDPSLLKEQMLMVLRQVARGTGSGTDVSIQSGGGNGAIFLQERYFPRKSFDGDTSASWIGEMQGLWYYIDPFIASSSGGGSTVREETVTDRMLILRDDRALSFGQGSVSLFYDRNGDGNSDNGAFDTVSPDAVQALWRAGKELWSRDLERTPRRIFTPLLPGGTEAGNSGLMRFSFAAPDHSAVLQPYLQSATAEEAVKVMKFVHGFDFPGDSTMRSRTVRIGNVPGPAVSSNPDDPYVTNPRDRGIGVWKLGDIISSTAKVQSSTPLSSYDLPAPRGYDDRSYRGYVGSYEYRNRGMIYLGANDGMLHAFRMGKLTAGTGAVTALLDPGNATPGEEAWAFMPRNVLPYLTYLKEPGYQHLYLVDGAVTLADVSIGDTGSGSCSATTYWNCSKPATVTMQDPLDPNRDILDPSKNTWRTVLIGSMGLGGASWGACSGAPDPAGTGAPCVPTPIADPADSSRRIGYSSYFALDVTDPASPSLLWEFSHPDLGYSTTGPAIVRVGAPDVNGRWFAVFGSGPTGAIKEQQFLGQSNRELKFFVVDLRSGELVRTISTGITNAFAGSISGGVIDDRWTGLLLVDGSDRERGRYQDDAIYVGYTAFHPESKSWTRGGVGRIMIDELPDPTQPTGSAIRDIWQWSRVMGYHPTNAASDSTGPVTTSVVRLQDTRHKNLWLYFGTGRYYYRSFQHDDFSGQRAIYGVKEPCYTNRGSGYLDKGCSATVCGSTTTDCLADQTASLEAVDRGWRIDLDPAFELTGAERVVADPVSMTGGAVFFPTFQPSAAPCATGNSFLWGVRYDTGGAVPAGWLQGKVLMQLSTGQLRETLPEGLTDKGNRRGPVMLGSKPAGIKVVTNSGLKPLRKIIHIQER